MLPRVRTVAAALLIGLVLAGQGARASAASLIVGIASRSEESGKPYEIRWPGGRRQRLAEWLTARLKVYEKEHPPGPDP